MNPAKNRKTSPELQKRMNPGPEKNARAYRTGPTPAAPEYSIPRGRGTSAVDHSVNKKQNQ